ncbi:MAG: PSD1 domain-containing protein [Planctomycetales bacterium]|nr:PSD1 domain-containing protein [Planctomycetales bacterium]
MPARSLVLWLAACILLLESAALAEEIGYNSHVRPILTEHCLHCHGNDRDADQSGPRLDLEEAAKQSAIVPGHPERSPLLERITAKDPELRMPPPDSGRALTDAEVTILRQWISQGAPYERHWSFEPIQKPAAPMAERPLESDIDRFLIAKLESRGLSMTPPVTRRQWLRRASFDLTGLPPTWEEVQRFEADSATDAYEQALDRLLASPRYGERWASHWLDVARYADTHGGSAIGFTKFPFSYTYRDYVIRALNADLPYDRFVTEQLAADQLGLDEHDPALAALGFLTVGMQFRNPHDTIDDQIDVVTRGLMALTVACARCHDHKYDPIPTADYYSLYATFASSSQAELPPVIGQPPDDDNYRRYRDELAQRQRIHLDMRRDQTEVMRHRLRMQVGLYLRELAKGTPEQDLSAAFLSYRTDDLRPLVLNQWRDYLATMPESDPVFGPWVQLSGLAKSEFGARCHQLLEQWRGENGDPAKFAKPELLTTAAPKWNPRVLDALAAKRPQSLLDVADAYGEVFAQLHREWLKTLLDTSLEAAIGADVVPDQAAVHRAANSAIDSQLRQHLYEPGTPTAMSDETAAKLLNRTVRDNLGGKRGAIHNLHLSSPGSPPRAMTLEESEDNLEFHVFRRGNPIDRGPIVAAGFLSALRKDNSGTRPFAPGQRRLALAESIVDPANPLLRRVVVNWVWQHHFGRGLVRTPDDFGARSDPPTHPQLLDYLAATLLEDGWSLKRLHKRIMLSAAYRQGAVENAEARKADPDNQLLWRMPRRRLDLEAMRDSMLAASGELDTSRIGGRPFDFLSQPITPRRTVYGFVNRDIISSLASTFDRANPATCTARRPETTVPQQTLFALNSEFIQDRAAALSQRAQQHAAAPKARIEWLFRELYSRDPAPDEVQAAERFLGDDDAQRDSRWTQLAHVLLAGNEFVFVD